VCSSDLADQDLRQTQQDLAALNFDDPEIVSMDAELAKEEELKNEERRKAEEAVKQQDEEKRNQDIREAAEQLGKRWQIVQSVVARQ
jgi:hypothetical protein